MTCPDLFTDLYGIPADGHPNSMRVSLCCLLLVLAGCRSAPDRETVRTAGEKMTDPVMIGGIPVPEGFTRIPVPPNSFAAWLRKLPLRHDRRVFLFDGRLKPNQSAQYAVLDLAIGRRDLQQCADVVMRLRAEYLRAVFPDSAFQFTDYAGRVYNWSGPGDSVRFDRYLQQVFGACGSASLEKQLEPKKLRDMEPGDVFIQGGFPGHAVLVADCALDRSGRRIFLLLQGYQPAQDIHILQHPADPDLSPWFTAEDGQVLHTPEWRFPPGSFRGWPQR